MKKFVCQVCGYVYEGETAPEKCPQCGVPGSKFTEVKDGEMKLAAEHEYGIYGKTVKNNADISAEDKAYILDQLKANFSGECSEVGMYLCMARIAHREGYPEIGLYWEKAAYEEAEHACLLYTSLAKHKHINLNGLDDIMVQPQAEHDTGGDAEDREQDILAVDVSLSLIHIS